MGHTWRGIEMDIFTTVPVLDQGWCSFNFMSLLITPTLSPRVFMQGPMLQMTTPCVPAPVWNEWKWMDYGDQSVKDPV